MLNIIVICCVKVTFGPASVLISIRITFLWEYVFEDAPFILKNGRRKCFCCCCGHWAFGKRDSCRWVSCLCLGQATQYGISSCDLRALSCRFLDKMLETLFQPQLHKYQLKNEYVLLCCLPPIKPGLLLCYQSMLKWTIMNTKYSTTKLIGLTLSMLLITLLMHDGMDCSLFTRYIMHPNEGKL